MPINTWIAGENSPSQTRTHAQERGQQGFMVKVFLQKENTGTFFSRSDRQTSNCCFTESHHLPNTGFASFSENTPFASLLLPHMRLQQI